VRLQQLEGLEPLHWFLCVGNMEAAQALVGRRSAGTQSYNPLGDHVHDRAADVWFCTAEYEVPFYKGSSTSERAGRFCTAGAKIIGRKSGDWIADKDSGAYLPYKCPDTGKRLFKNERVMMFDKSQSFGEIVGLQSFYSMSTVDSCASSGKMERQASLCSVQSVKSVASQLSTAEVEPQSSWVCCANQGVPHFSDPNPDAVKFSGTLCLLGTKINAVKQGNWLKLVERKESVDVLGTIGRRSMTISRQTSFTESGSFLPLFDTVTGERLFKNEKVDAWEKATTAKSANQLLSDSSSELGAKKQSCAVM